MEKINDPEECCPVFDPAPYNEKTHIWVEKMFIRDYLPQFFHIPFPPMMARMMSRMWKKAEDAGALTEKKDFLLLAYDPSPWKSEFSLCVTKEVPGAENIKLSGTFISNVFDGPYNNVPKFIKEADNYLASLGKKAKKYYFYFTTCPKCAKKYGHNFIVSFAEI